MKIFNIVNFLFKRSLKNKYSLTVYILIPIIGLLFPLIISNRTNKDERVNVALIDMDKSDLSQGFSELLVDKYNFNVKHLDYTDAKKQLIDNKISAILVVPNNFKENLILHEKPTIELTYIKENESSNWLKQVINTYIVNLNILADSSNRNIETFDKLYNEFTQENSSIKVNITGEAERSGVLASSTLGFMMLFMIMIVSNSFSLIINDRNRSSYGRILSTSTTNTEYILGHVIWNGLMCLIESILLIGIIYILNINIGISLNNFFILLLLISIISISIGIFCVSFCRTEEQVTLVNTLIIFPSCMLSGCLWPIEIMNNTLQKLSYIFPQRYIFIIMEQLQQSLSGSKVAINICLILLISALIFIIGIFNIERVSLKELA